MSTIRLFTFYCLTSITILSCANTSSQETYGKERTEKGSVGINRSEHPEYMNLQLALQKYNELKKEGGWQELPVDLDAPELEEVLKKRLGLPGKDVPNGIDASEVISHFQRTHGLAPTGQLDEATLQALNIPVKDKMRMIRASLNNWKKLPDHLGDRYIIVNIPDFSLKAYENDRKVLEMKAIVGAASEAETPTFNNKVRYLTFNPYWNIPHNLVLKKMLPQARHDVNYLSMKGYEIVSSFETDAEILEPTPENLDKLERKELFLRQRPGPYNSMGKVKFMFPNEHIIYLHDTPHYYLFDEPQRAFSNGCIRIEDPVALAEFLLYETKGGWDKEKIQQVMQDSELLKVDLDEPVPIYITYWTAFADETGDIHFRKDIYGKY